MALSKIDGVESVKIDFKKKTAAVAMKDGKSLDKATAEKALKDARLGLTSFQETTTSF